MEMYTLKDLNTGTTVAIIDQTEMSLEEAFDYIRKENKELNRQLATAVECIEMFIKSCGSCALCVKQDCKLRDKHREWGSLCKPIWSGGMDAAAR